MVSPIPKPMEEKQGTWERDTVTGSQCKNPGHVLADLHLDTVPLEEVDIWQELVLRGERDERGRRKWEVGV